MVFRAAQCDTRDVKIARQFSGRPALVTRALSTSAALSPSPVVGEDAGRLVALNIPTFILTHFTNLPFIQLCP